MAASRFHRIPAGSRLSGISQPGGLVAAVTREDRRLARLLAVLAVPAIRLSLGLVYVWFGAEKVIGPDSNFKLVTDTLYWFPAAPEDLIPWMGVGEMIIGSGFLVGRGLFLHLCLFAFFIHMGGTFLVLPVLPEVAFRHGNPFLLTKIGEYVIKNVVWVAASLAVYASIWKPKDDRD